MHHFGTVCISTQSIFIWKSSAERPLWKKTTTHPCSHENVTNFHSVFTTSSPISSGEPARTVSVLALTYNPEHSAGRSTVQRRVGCTGVGAAIIILYIRYHQMILVS